MLARVFAKNVLTFDALFAWARTNRRQRAVHSQPAPAVRIAQAEFIAAAHFRY